jgi:glycosyltransferase involved in cell wall biosynthesis
LIEATIVIPCYNAAAYLDTAIRSALAQTVREVEVIAVDDCSTDATPAMLAEWAARDPRVVLVRTARNGGPAAACNAAYDRARGRWVTVLDSDDLFTPQRIERLVAIGEERGADMVADNLIEQDFESGRDLGLHFPDGDMRVDGFVTLEEMLRRDMPDLPGKSRLGFVQPLIRRDFLQRHRLYFPTAVRAGEDFVHYFECVAHGARFTLTPEAHYVYRIRAGSITFRPSSTYHYSVANRHMRGVLRRLGIGGQPAAMLARRQRLVDFNCLAQAAIEGDFAKAARYLRPGAPGHLLRQARVLGGALRRRVAARDLSIGPQTGSRIGVE